MATTPNLNEMRLALTKAPKHMAEGGSDDDYRGSHQAPGPHFGAPMHDVSGNGMYPEDFYSPKGVDYYANINDPIDREAHRQVLSVKGKPDAMVTIHRAIPTHVHEAAMKTQDPIKHMIRHGDWVAIHKGYAKIHGEGPLKGKYKIASMRVPAKHVWTSADSIHEWGYHPEENTVTKAKGGNIRHKDLGGAIKGLATANNVSRLTDAPYIYDAVNSAREGNYGDLIGSAVNAALPIGPALATYSADLNKTENNDLNKTRYVQGHFGRQERTWANGLAEGGPAGMPEELRARYEAAKAQTAMRAELERQYNEEMKDKYTKDMVPFAQWLASKSKPHMAEGGGMYSAVDRALANLPRNKGTGQEFLNELMNRPGVKPTEIKERGLDTALAGMPKADKAAVQKVASRNNPAPKMLQTIKLADPYSHPEFDRMLQEVQEMYTPVDDYGRPMKRLSEIEANDLAVKELGGHAKFNEKNYNVPGGMNYREMLLHLPKQKSEYSNYYGPHWDEPNVVAHMRMADRATPEGKKILHLEELQSDWHQDGRDKGYSQGLTPEEQIEQAKLKKLPLNELMDNPQLHERFSFLAQKNKGVPNGPFKKNWEEYALKHLLNHAVENGYQHIAITPGAIQNKRWQRENDPKGMEAAYDKRIPNILNSLGKQFGVQVRHNGMFTPDQEGNLHPLHTFEITPEMSEHIAKHGFPAYKEGGAMRKPKPTVMNAQRIAYPGIYKDPRVIAAEAAQQVAPEHPSLKQLFGVTREDLYQMGKGRKGNLPGELPGQVDKPRGSSAAAQVMTNKNEQRLLDAMGEAEKHHALVQGMDPWYIMDPMFSHMVRLLGHEKATEEYNKMNHLMGMASPGSEVMTEIPRGTAAYMLQQQGRFPEFVKYAGVAESKRGKKFPADIRNVPGHAYHKTAQAKPMEQFLNTGEIQMKSPKVPMYIQASGVPATGFQTATPVGDAHWSRAVGLADTRNPQTRKGKEITPGASVSTPEMTMLAPWWRQQIAGKLGIESVPAQARAWGTFSPQTGVTTPIGAPKLELIARQIMETANRLGIAPEQARDMVLTGKTYAGKADGGSVTPETVPGANPLEGNQNTGAQVNFYPTPQNQSQYQQNSAGPSEPQGMQSPLGDINVPTNPITDNTSTQQTPYTPDQTWANQPSRGLTNPLSKITSPLAAYAMGGGVDIKNVGVDEAPEMPIKAFVLPGATRKNPFPVGGIDFQPQMPGQQLTPQMPGQPPQGPQQGQQPQGQQAQGAPQGQPPSNILQMTPQGQAMNAMTPPAQAQGPTAMAKGGKVYALPGYRHEELHIAPSGDQMQYELMMAKHYIKKAK